MQDSLAVTATAVNQIGCSLTFRYSVLTQKITVGRFICERYGIRVEQPCGECCEVHNITFSSTQIQSLIALLARNCVTPCTLTAVVEDWKQTIGK